MLVNVINPKIGCIFALRIRQIRLITRLQKLPHLYNDHKGIVFPYFTYSCLCRVLANFSGSYALFFRSHLLTPEL
jgi:hypothetical protein